MPSLRVTTTLSLVTVLFVATTTPVSAATPERNCQAAKNKAAGSYAACRQKAEAKLVTNGDATKYVDALAKCGSKFTSSWQKAIDKAANAGATCLDDPLTVGDFQPVIDDHTDRLALALAGGGLTDCVGDPATVLRTGQTTSYGTSSDGHLLRGASRSYTDNGDGTITDNTTGLMWEKKSDDGSVHDKDNMYAWGMTSSPYAMNGGLVTGFLATLNAGGGFAGHTDWRIPNMNELLSLVNYQNVSPAIDSIFNTGCVPGCTPTTGSCTEGSSWSSTTYQPDPDEAWYVVFGSGLGNPISKGFLFTARAVRGGL